MITSVITFILDSDHLPVWKLDGLKRLSGLFKSITIWRNLSREQQCNLEQTLNVLSIKNMDGDLCQLIIEGLDAELACMVLTEFVSQKFHLISTTHLRKKTAITDESVLSEILNTQPFLIHFIQEPLCELTKDIFIYRALKLIAETDESLIPLFGALQKRELVSSTYLGELVALPHAIHPSVHAPTIVIQRLAEPVSWSKPEQFVSLIILLLLPEKPDRSILLPATLFSRWLLNAFNRQVLVDMEDNFTLEFIIRYVMSHYQPT